MQGGRWGARGICKCTIGVVGRGGLREGERIWPGGVGSVYSFLRGPQLSLPLSKELCNSREGSHDEQQSSLMSVL